MDFYETVVMDYLRADRAIFLNTEYCIQINPGNPESSGALHWYCDAVAIDTRDKAIYLCEASYSKELRDLKSKLRGWHENWPGVRAAIVRDSLVPEDWPVRPWLFVPNSKRPRLKKILDGIGGHDGLMFAQPRITDLEEVVPWKYPSWNRSPYAVQCLA